jgi:hypothetical protein
MGLPMGPLRRTVWGSASQGAGRALRYLGSRDGLNPATGSVDA